MNNQIQALAVLPKLSEQQLIQALQGGSSALPAYAVMAELEARKKRAAGFAGNGVAPRTSVKQDMVQQASGLQSFAPQGQPAPMAQAAPQGQPMGMAAGGMIPEYADGGTPSDEELSYIERLRAQGLNPVGGGILDYFRDPNRKPIFDVLADKVGGMFTPSAAAPAAPTAAASPWAGRTGNGPPVYHAGVAPAAPAQAPVAKPPAAPGIGSISASMGSRTGPAGAVDASFTPTPIKLRSMAEVLKDLPQDTSIQEQIAAIKNSDASEQNKKQALGMMLFNWGAKTASTAGPTLSALGAGAQEGLKTYATQDAENRREANERRKELGLLSIGQGRQKMMDYEVARRQQMDEGIIQDKANDNLFAAKKLAVESGNHALDRATQLQVASIHATAAKASQLDYNMQRLVQTTQSQASDDFDKMTTTGMGSVKYGRMDPAQLNGLRQSYIAERLKTIPGIEKYWVAPPTARAPGFMSGPPKGVEVVK